MYPDAPSQTAPRHPSGQKPYPRAKAHVRVKEACIHCGLCAAHCAFLSGQKTPGRMAEAYESAPEPCLDMAFGCSQCGLCTFICPKNLDLPAMFLDWRRQAVSSGRADLAPYHGILAYEKKGCSPLFSYYHLPRGCHTVFFPGCTLTGTRPDQTLKAFDYLRNQIPTVGMVLDCCTKPSHDLGRREFFDAMFSEMCRYLQDHGVSRIVTACPSCHTLFSARGPFTVVSIYQVMAEDKRPDALPCLTRNDRRIKGSASPVSGGQKVVVQDPCQARKDRATQRAVRTMAKRAGLDLIPTKASGPATLCCGEGASVGCVSPGLAKTWTVKRKKAADKKTTLTYCAGCVNLLGGPRDIHFIDLAFDPEATLAGRAKVARAPVTYLNRLRVKQRLKALPSAHSRRRTFFHGKTKGTPARIRRLVAAMVLAVLATGAGGIVWL